MKKSLIGALVFIAPLTLQASQLHVEYSKFYSHLRKLDKEETSELQFSFGFMHNTKGELCTIESVLLVTQKLDIDVNVNNDQRFILPVEKALKLANASVLIDMVEPSNQCDMSVQLETKPVHLSTTLESDKLRLILAQYEEFFDNMGSFLSFLMPGVEGITIWLPESESYTQLDLIEEGVTIDGHKLTLNKDWVEGNVKELELPVKPIRITSVVSK